MLVTAGRKTQNETCLTGNTLKKEFIYLTKASVASRILPLNIKTVLNAP